MFYSGITCFTLTIVLSHYSIGKFIDLNKNDDPKAVLNMLNNSDADFSSDDGADESYIPFNVHADAEESDESSCDERSFYNTEDQTNTSVACILEPFKYCATAISN